MVIIYMTIGKRMVSNVVIKTEYTSRTGTEITVITGLEGNTSEIFITDTNGNSVHLPGLDANDFDELSKLFLRIKEGTKL